MPVERVVERQAERGDPGVVAVGVVVVMVVRVIECGGVQPAGDVGDFGGRIEQAGVQDEGRIDRAMAPR